MLDYPQGEGITEEERELICLARSYDGPMDKQYTYDQIINLSTDQIREFAAVFGFEPELTRYEDIDLNRERIFKILNYLGLITVEEELIQPHIVDYLCQELSLDELNNYRIANQLDTITCPIKVLDRSRSVYIHFPELTNQNYILIKGIETFGSNRLYELLVSNRDLSNFKLLVEYGVPPPTNLFIQALTIGLTDQNPYFEMIKYMLDNQLYEHEWDPISAMAISAFKKYWDFVIDMVESGYSPESALESAVNYENEDMVRYLLEHGINNSTLLNSSLRTASGLGNLNIVKLLVEYGADINSVDENYTTALMNASRSGHFDVIQYLVENGARLNSKNLGGNTALDLVNPDSDMHPIITVYLRLMEGRSGRWVKDIGG